jgi:hypothetical protein
VLDVVYFGSASNPDEEALAGAASIDDGGAEDIANAALVVAGAGPADGDQLGGGAKGPGPRFDGQRGSVNAHAGAGNDGVLVIVIEMNFAAEEFRWALPAIGLATMMRFRAAGRR